MTSTDLKVFAPLETPLPPPRDGEVLTDSQWTTLLAIADTVIPSIEVSSQLSSTQLSVQSSEYTTSTEVIKRGSPLRDSSDVVRQFLSERASSTPGFKEHLQRLLGEYVRDDAQKGIRIILSTLDTRAGCLLTTGYTTSFHLQPVNIRQQILRGWSQSYLPPLRNAVKSFQMLMASTWLRTSPTLGAMLGFPKSPIHGKPGKGFDYEFIHFPPGDEPEVLETDVVIIGSGCGGGVSAKNLAEAGQRVIVVEQAYHWGPQHLPMNEKDAGVHLFENGGVEVSDDNSIASIAGRAWGGGGTVNWSASLQTQGFVRQEWADGGLPFFTSSEYQNSLDRVCQRMGVSTDHIEHNPNNRMLAEGARKLGYSYKAVPQNTGGNKHHCGYCTLGCGAAEKQGPNVSFLPDAAAAGAHFIEGFRAEKVLFEQVKGKKTATGVQGLWTSRDSQGGVSGSDRTTRQVIIKAKRVILSAGTYHSPLILLRSGLKNPHIGRNLHLHPTTLITATYPDREKPMNPWEGAILTYLVDEFQNLDGHHHGVKLEPMTMLPAWVLAFQPWRGGLEYKELCSKLPYMTSHLILVRDRDTGRVFADPVDGRPRIEYTPSNFDKKHAIEGLCAAARIAYVNGAKEIFTSSSAMLPFIRSSSTSSPSSDDTDDTNLGINDPAFQSWLTELRRRGLPQPETNWGVAHQMGTCRMAATQRAGVVDPKGRVWEAEGLYVADASVFPSASGVNPMVTNMAISDWISRGVARDLRLEGRKEEGARL